MEQLSEVSVVDYQQTVTEHEETNHSPKDDTSPPETTTYQHNVGKPPSAKTSKRSKDKCDSVLESIEQHFKKPKVKEDRYDVLGKSVAVKMKDIRDNKQKLIAEKLINDALFLAEMGQLDMSHSIRSSSENMHSSRLSSFQQQNNSSHCNEPVRIYGNFSQGIANTDNSNLSISSYLTNFND